jgi:hypothetical protein
MIGIWAGGASRFLLILAAVTTPAFALPILLMPLRWARLVQWHVPEQTDLAVYFGRCLGAFVLVIEVLMVSAAYTGTGLAVVFPALLLLWSLMIVIHVVGAFEGSQPMTETLEIGFWAVLVFLTLACWPHAGTGA